MLVYKQDANVAPRVDGTRRSRAPLACGGSRASSTTGAGITAVLLRELAPAHPELALLAPPQNYGQTRALQAGFDPARGEATVTVEGDLQNAPPDIPRRLDGLARGADAVSGWRCQR